MRGEVGVKSKLVVFNDSETWEVVVNLSGKDRSKAEVDSLLEMVINCCNISFPFESELVMSLENLFLEADKDVVKGDTELDAKEEGVGSSVVDSKVERFQLICSESGLVNLSAAFLARFSLASI